MEYLNILFFIMLFVFVGYVAFIWIKYGIQPSISESYYKLPKSINWLFTLFCWGFAIPALIIGVQLTDNFLMFLAASGICFVGAAAAFKQTLTKNVHMIGAYCGILFSQLSILFDFNIPVVVAATLLWLIIFQLYAKNKIWWQEIVAFMAILVVFAASLFLS